MTCILYIQGEGGGRYNNGTRNGVVTLKGLRAADHVSCLSSYEWKHEGYILKRMRGERPGMVDTVIVHSADRNALQGWCEAAKPSPYEEIVFHFHINATSILSF